MQLAYRPEVEIQVLRGQIETLRNQVDGFLELHQGDADILDVFRAQRLFFQAPHRLTLHQLADEFNETQDEFYNRLLHIFGVRVPSERMPGFLRWGVLPAQVGTLWGCPTFRARSRAAARASALFFHAVFRFFAGVIAGPPITFLISLIKSCGKHGLVMTTSHPALFALSE